MHNYEHEIEMTGNKAMDAFLWSDYFHDSEINHIDFLQEKQKVVLTMRCCRDTEDYYRNAKVSYKEITAYIKDHPEEFIYVLTFSNVAYFNITRMSGCNDYINGRFKDSVILKKLQKENNRKLYHLRIQFDDGFGDVIFSKFEIKKKIGKIKYPKYEPWQAAGCSTAELNFDNEFDKFLAMQQLFKDGDFRVLDMARETIKSKEYLEDTKPYSAYILGKLGNKDDLPILFDYYLKIEKDMLDQSICLCSTLMYRQNILDAIEEINYREQNL